MNKNLIKNIIKFEDNSILQLVCGIYHENLDLIEKKLNVSLTPKGNEISITGKAENILITKNTLLKLYERAKLTDIIEKNDINSIITFMEEYKKKEKKINNLEKIYIEIQAKRIFPRSIGQLNFMKNLSEIELIFAIGPAGTGKTFLAVSYAVSLLISGKIDKIIISRPAVEAGEKLGFLPGDLKQKIDPYLRPIYDALHEILPYQKVLKLIENEKIEIAPIAYIRGRTLNNSYIILDEAQNTSAIQMKMFLTRLGINSKMVVTGDLTQIDLPNEKKSGLLDVEKNLKKIKNISFVYLSEKDVVRHSLVSEIIKAYRK